MLVTSISLGDRSIAPEVLETGRRQLGVAHRVLDVLVAEIGLQRAGIDAVIGELETAGVAQHVRMHWEIEVSRDTEPGDHLAESRRREWCTAFGREDNGDAGSCSRLSRRSARNSRPDSGWTDSRCP